MSEDLIEKGLSKVFQDSLHRRGVETVYKKRYGGQILVVEGEHGGFKLVRPYEVVNYSGDVYRLTGCRSLSHKFPFMGCRDSMIDGPWLSKYMPCQRENIEVSFHLSEAEQVFDYIARNMHREGVEPWPFEGGKEDHTHAPTWRTYIWTKTASEAYAAERALRLKTRELALIRRAKRDAKRNENVTVN